LSQGQRLTWVDEAATRRQIVFIDRICLPSSAVIHRSIRTGRREEVEIDGRQDVADLMRRLILNRRGFRLTSVAEHLISTAAPAATDEPTQSAKEQTPHESLNRACHAFLLLARHRRRSPSCPGKRPAKIFRPFDSFSKRSKSATRGPVPPAGLSQESTIKSMEITDFAPAGFTCATGYDALGIGKARPAGDHHRRQEAVDLPADGQPGMWAAPRSFSVTAKGARLLSAISLVRKKFQHPLARADRGISL